MKICTDDRQKRCDIWLCHQEAALCRADPSFWET